MPELKASEVLAQHRNLIYRRAIEKLKAEQTLDEAELAEVGRREAEDQKQRERIEKSQKKETRGRPSKLTSEIISKICAIVEDGGTYADACLECGIEPETLSRWKGREEKGGLYLQLSQGITAARARYLNKHAKNISRQGTNGAWQASLAILERRAPETWGRKDRLTAEHTGPGGVPLEGGSVTVILIPDNGYKLPENEDADTETVSLERNGIGGNGAH